MTRNFFLNAAMGHKACPILDFYFTKENLFILDAVLLVVGVG